MGQTHPKGSRAPSKHMFSAPSLFPFCAGAHGYFMKHRNSEATTEKRLKAFNGYVANLLRDMK